MWKTEKVKAPIETDLWPSLEGDCNGGGVTGGRSWEILEASESSNCIKFRSKREGPVQFKVEKSGDLESKDSYWNMLQYRSHVQMDKVHSIQRKK